MQTLNVLKKYSHRLTILLLWKKMSINHLKKLVDFFEYYGDMHANHNSAQTKQPSMAVQVYSATDNHLLQKIEKLLIT